MSTDTSIEALRRHLFDAIAGVKAGTVDVDKARAINDLSQTIVNTAKVEVDYLRTVSGKGSSFMSSALVDAPPALPTPTPGQVPPAGQARPGNGITSITQHICRDD